MKTITITKEIDCDELTCGKCSNRNYRLTNTVIPQPYCDEFKCELKMTWKFVFIRCPECLGAEKAGGLNGTK
jgi:hypothetical protein